MTLSSIKQAKAYALFRKPHSTHYTAIIQRAMPRTFHSIADVPLTGGYVVVPFVCDAQCPILFIEPDETLSLPMSVPCLSVRSDSKEGNSDAERSAYAQAFRAAKEKLASGELQKVVLSRRKRLTTENQLDPAALFMKACHYRPNSFVALWHTPQSGTWLVATPEPLLTYSHRKWNTVALAGTLPWTEGKLPQWNNKNREEQAIVARFIHDNLTDVATDVKHSGTYTLHSGNIQHLCTDFSFQLPSAEQLHQVLLRLHPTPAVCGLPRMEAKSTIVSHESSPRRYYAGFSGPLLLDGQTDLYVSLRCMEFSSHHATLYAGGGIMPESIEQEEWEETERKLETMAQIIKR